MQSPIDHSLLLDSLPSAVLLLDQELQVCYANLAAQSLLQLSSRYLLGYQLIQVLNSDSLSRQRLLYCLQRGEAVHDNDACLQLAGGGHIEVALSVNPFEDAQMNGLLVQIDHSEQHKRIAQESVLSAQLQASRALVRSLAHEIKNPLGGIRGAAQLLERQPPGADNSEFSQLIIEQVDRLGNLVDRLLGPNQLPHKKMQNVHRVLEQVRLLVEADSHFQSKLMRDYDPSIPDAYFDAEMLQQALLNIVRNAQQAVSGQGMQGQIRLQSRVARQVTINGQRYALCILLQVRDNGPGIAPELRDTLFYPMVTSKADGSGLGLSIAQSIMHNHGGKIEVQSQPGDTRFTLYLPLQAEPV